jgi:hypothetical protein
MWSSYRPSLWSSDQSTWLQIRRPGFDPRHYQINKSSGSGTGSTQPREYNWGATWQKSGDSCLENREYGREDPSRWPRSNLYPHMLAITSPTSGGRSVGIVHSRTQTTEFFLSSYLTARPPLRSSGQSSWLQIRSAGFDSRHYQKKNCGSGTGSTQPREYNWGATW